jgi:hypothetical protein
MTISVPFKNYNGKMTVADFHTGKEKEAHVPMPTDLSLPINLPVYLHNCHIFHPYIQIQRQISMSKTAKKANPCNSKGPSDIWRNATSQPTSLSSHRMAAKVYIDKLNLTTDQKSQIQDIYTSENIQDFTYLPDDESQQISATALLATHQLDFDARESLASRWSIKWRVNSGAGKKADCRVLYQWCASAI